MCGCLLALHRPSNIRAWPVPTFCLHSPCFSNTNITSLLLVLLLHARTQPRLLQFGEKVPSSVSCSSLHAITKTSHALFSHMHRPTFQVSLNSLLWFVLQSPRSFSRARRSLKVAGKQTKLWYKDRGQCCDVLARGARGASCRSGWLLSGSLPC